MNRDRRRQIAELIARVDDMRSEVEYLRDAERAAVESMPDAVREGGKGDAMRRAAGHLSHAAAALAEAGRLLEDARA